MAQLVLNPENTTTGGNWVPRGPIPPRLRKFGRFPDVSLWLPGDLILFSALKPGWISRRIVRAQTHGGYAEEDARWHHAAVYLGDDKTICEATPFGGVGYIPIFGYIGGYLLRIRRDQLLSPEQRWQIAMQSLTRLGKGYGFGSILGLAFQSWRGFWRPPFGLPSLGAKSLICSQLFADSYSFVSGRLVSVGVQGPITPAALSHSPLFQDVQTQWLAI